MEENDGQVERAVVQLWEMRQQGPITKERVETIVSQQAAQWLSNPVLHSVPVKSEAGTPGDYAGHGMKTLLEEQHD